MYEYFLHRESGGGSIRRAWTALSFARQRSGQGIANLIHTALYADINEITPSVLARELASLHLQLPNSLIVTTNYDPILEIALRDLLADDGHRTVTSSQDGSASYSVSGLRNNPNNGSHRRDFDAWRQDLFPSGADIGQVPALQRAVLHLHGFLPFDLLDDNALHPVLLSESDYARFGSLAAERLADVFSSRIVILVGLSATDPSILAACKIARARRTGEEVPPVFLLRPVDMHRSGNEATAANAVTAQAYHLYSEYGFKTIFLRNFGQQIQLIHDLNYYARCHDLSLSPSPYGIRLSTALQALTKSQDNIPGDAIDTRDEEAADADAVASSLTQALDRLHEKYHWAIVKPGSSRLGSGEVQGIEIWLRQQSEEVDHEPYSLTRVATTQPTRFDGQPYRPRVDIFQRADCVAIECVSQGEALASKHACEDVADNWWSSGFGVPLFVEIPDEHGQPNRLLVGACVICSTESLDGSKLASITEQERGDFTSAIEIVAQDILDDLTPLR